MKQFPSESEGLGQSEDAIECVPDVNDGSASLLDSFKIWPIELEVLARDYLDQVRAEEFAIEFLGGSSDLRMYLYQRLGDIADVLGKERLQKAVASVDEEKWDRRFAEAEQFEKNLDPCMSCGEKRTHADYVHCPDTCTSCGNSITSPARPPRYIHRSGSRTVVDLSKIEEGKS